MTLAARCPSCRTAFRVVQDQLKVSNGWVRCGRCAAVFNANETLFELEVRAPAAAPAPPPAAPQPPAVVVVPGTPITASGGLAAAATPPEDGGDVDQDRAWSEPLPTPKLSVDELHAALFGPMPKAAETTTGESPAESTAAPFDGPIGEPIAAPINEPLDGPIGEPAPDWTDQPVPELRSQPSAEMAVASDSHTESEASLQVEGDERDTAPVVPAMQPEPAPPLGAARAGDVDASAQELEGPSPAPDAQRAVHRDAMGAEGGAGGEPTGDVVADTGAAEPEIAPNAAETTALESERSQPPQPAAQDAMPAATTVETSADTASETASTTATEAPAFVREAERAARWRAPEVRAALAAAAFLLSGAAVLQGTRAFHEPIAHQWPAARAWLEPLCRMAGCDDGPRRRISGLSVENSSLVKVDESGHAMRLSLVLRNRDRQPLVLPAIELTLTDVYGGLVARKVFQPRELGARAASLDAGAELVLQAVLDTGEPRVIGYTIEIFYP